jgi:hypothetical protein
VAGENYKFKVRARNSVGFSEDSNETIIRAAALPDVPTDVQTVLIDGYIVVSWTEPYDGGSPISAYEILIQHDDGVQYSQDLVNCDGSDSTIVAQTTCSVPTSVLITDPFDLPFGSSIYAKVKAVNLVGSSDYSAVGNGGILLTTPGAPLSFANNVAVSDKTQIGLTWYQGINNGGIPVIDYRI